MKRDIPEDRRVLLAATLDGISESEASQLRERFGSNLIAEQPPRSAAMLARDAAGDPMIWFLLFTSGLFGVLGQFTDMAVLLGAIVPLLGMDLYLHRRTQASLEGLKSILASEASVVRDGAEKRVKADQVVPGDLVVVRSGEAFPADGVVLEGENLQAEEASLTGEAYPVTKHAYASAGKTEEESWIFAGTRLLTGTARARIIFAGSDTLYGEVVRSVVTGPQGRTPLQQEVSRLVRVLLIVAAAICVLLGGVRLWQGFGLIDAFLSAATLAVAAIPEEFPVVLTFFLGVGVYRLARSKALVRRAIAVENIGRVSAICSDKTGTITEGRLVFQDAIPAKGVERSWLMMTATLAARQDSGDPLDVAILEHAPAVPESWVRERVFPFTENRRRETSYWRRDGDVGIFVAKGAAETILSLCNLSKEADQNWSEKVHLSAAEGKKVIACAWQEAAAATDLEPVSGFQLAGLIAVSDPLRNGVREAIAEARSAGIQVIMVTGDHPVTASAIAMEAGLADQPAALMGDQLETELRDLTTEELLKLSVVARATPAQKVLLTKALQRTGRIVAVTGDGVNDAPALRAADVGIAMGLRGTRSAREVSSIILMDDNFRTIITAIREGRQLFTNLRMSFAFLLMIHIPLVATAAIIPFLGYPLLYLPVHIVWLELLIHPAAILGFQRPASDPLRREMVREQRGFFDWKEWFVIAGVGAVIALIVLLIFTLESAATVSVETDRAMAMVALVSALAVLLAVLTRLTTWFSKVVTAAAILSSVAFTQMAGWAEIIRLQPLSFEAWLFSAAAGGGAGLGAALFRSSTSKS